MYEKFFRDRFRINSGIFSRTNKCTGILDEFKELLQRYMGIHLIWLCFIGVHCFYDVCVYVVSFM